MDEEKTQLRERFDRYRRSLDEETYENLSHRAIDRLIRLPEIRGAHVIHVYWPMTDRREVDTRPFIHWLKDQRKEIILPVVINFTRGADGPRLKHVRYPGEEGLRLNRWGITEPDEHQPVPIDDIEAIVVPALGAGRNGHRIGHGFGYYDEFLSAAHVPKIALVYDACLLDAVPFEEHDRRVEVIVTEEEVVRPSPQSR